MKFALSAKKQIMFDGVTALVIAAVLVYIGITAPARIESEKLNNKVEICLDYNEMLELCALNNYPVSDFLERSKAIGVSSVALKEETLRSMSDSGKIVYFSGADYSREKMLDLTSQGGMIAPNLIATQDHDISVYLSALIPARYNIQVKNQKAGKYYLIYPSVTPELIPAYWNDEIPLGFSTDKINILQSKALKTVYNIQNSGNPEWIAQLPSDNMSAVIWENPEIPGFPGREDILLKALEKANYKYIDMEFSNISGEEYLKRNLPELLVRGHQIAVNEIGRNSDQNFWISRWARAVFERNIRFVEFHFWKNRTIEDNLSYLRSVSRKIKSCGYELDAAVPPSFPKRGSLQIWICLALLVSVIFPLAGLKYALKLNNYFYAFLTVNFFSLIGASLIGCLLYDIYFLQKIADMPYVRIVFFLPIVFSIFLLFKTEDIKRIVNTGLQVKHLIIAVFVILVATVIIIRSGNSSAEWMNPDQGFRQMLENLLLIRPRTKEFLVGQPILLLGFFFKNPWLILIGMIGQVSIMNTFMHAHSSFMVSLIRTFNGLWVGLILGVIVLEIYKAVASKKQIKK